MNNVIIKMRRCKTRYAYGYFEPEMFNGFEPLLYGLDNTSDKIYYNAMSEDDNVIKGEFLGTELDLVQTMNNIKALTEGTQEVVIIALTDNDKLKVLKTCDDSLASELILDALYITEPDIFLELEQDEE